MKNLTILESMKLAKKHGIKFPKHKVANTEVQLRAACKKIGFPVALKVIAGHISHKSEKGGVQIGIANQENALRAFRKIQKLGGNKSVLVMEMVKGTEVIIGGKRDPQFGPTVLFGLGGIYVELFKDVKIAICPVSRKTALEMVKGIKAYPVLAGMRGKRKEDLGKIAFAILKVSNLMWKEKNVSELDLNPLILTSNGPVAVDARAVVDK